VCGGVLGAPLGTWLIERRVARRRVGTPDHSAATQCPKPNPVCVYLSKSTAKIHPCSETWSSSRRHGPGRRGDAEIQGRGVTLPAYIGAMLVASVLRNLDDRTGCLRISVPLMDLIGNVSLLLFLALALLNLRLWELANLALPLVCILLAQVLVMGLFALLVSFR